MPRVYSADNIFESEEFKFLAEGLEENPYKPTAWGYAHRPWATEGMNYEILVAERHKHTDQQRKGQLVIPGGELKSGENYFAAALRETREETGVAVLYNGVVTPRFRVFVDATLIPREKAIGIIDKLGYIWFEYRDSGKRYAGHVIDLYPSTDSNPREQEDSDARNPRFMKVQDILNQQNSFTPVCQILLDLIFDYGGIKPFHKEGDIAIEGNILRTMPFP